MPDWNVSSTTATLTSAFISANNTSHRTARGFDGSRTVGDLAVSMDFSNGGTLGSVTVYKWNGSIYDQVQAVGGEGCNTDHTVCAFNNGVPITGIQGDAIDVNAFKEIGVDVTALIPNGGALPCFPDVMFVSRPGSKAAHRRSEKGQSHPHR